MNDDDEQMMIARIARIVRLSLTERDGPGVLSSCRVNRRRLASNHVAHVAHPASRLLIGCSRLHGRHRRSIPPTASSLRYVHHPGISLFPY